MDKILQIFDPASYFLNPFALAPLVVAVLNLGFFGIFSRLDTHSLINRSFGFVSLSCSVWLLGLGSMFSSSTPAIAFFWAHVMYLGMVLAAVSFFGLSSAAAGRFAPQKFLIAAAFLWAIASFFKETRSWDGIEVSPYGFFPLTFHPPVQMLLFIASCFLLSIGNFIYRHIISQEKDERRRLRFLMLCAVFFCAGYVDLIHNLYSLSPFGFIVLGGVTISLLSLGVTEYAASVRDRTKKMEEEIDKKSVEISQVVGELRATQLKLIETGKISAVASLSAGILHQISQPITAIHGFVRFIKKEMKPEDVFYKPICLMDEQSQYLKEMLEDLMDLIRHREIKKENININTYVNRAVSLLTDELRIRRVNWDLILEDNIPSVFADGVHLQQVFMNVIINAIQALSLLPRGSARYLKISSEFNLRTNLVMVSFKDSGPGLTQEDRRHIFEPFFSTKTKGSGIGLALCKDLIDEHGGKIDVESVLGHGANFMIQLPCADTQIASVSPEPAANNNNKDAST